MLTLPLVLSLALAAPPRGLPAATPQELVAQVDQRLPKWLTGGGDRKAVLANAAELEAFIAGYPVAPADKARLLANLKEEQAITPTRKTFTSTKAALAVSERQTVVAFFDDEGSCELAFAPTADGKRLVLLSGPMNDDNSPSAFAERHKGTSQVLQLEKKGKAWELVAPAKPAAPTCADVMAKAAKSVFIAEKSYYAEYDSYSDSLEKVGVDTKSLGITSVKVTVKGTGATASFSADVASGDGLVRVTDQSGEVTVVKPCTK